MAVALSPNESLKFAVLQHVPCEPPAAYGTVLEKYGTPKVFLMGRDPVPDLDVYDAVIAMGGPMGVYDVGPYPWLPAEVQSVRSALAAGVAVWGVCLGAQILAAAADGDVYPGPHPEVGITAVELTAEARTDPIFAGIKGPLTVLQWHGDGFDLPADAVLLATAGEYPNQAFRLGRSYGLQFHLETPAELAEEWLDLPAYRSSLADARGANGAQLLRAELRAAEAQMAATAETLMVNWLEALRHA